LDAAVAAAMRNSKPVYISVCCNLAGEVHPSFAGKLSKPHSWGSHLHSLNHASSSLHHATQTALLGKTFATVT